jgi:hypothetical protein
MQTTVRSVTRLAVVGLASAFGLACGIYPAWLEPAEAGPDFPIQGEYAAEGVGAQVVALGGGHFTLVQLAGGLPGAGWDGQGRTEVDGYREVETDPVEFEDGSVIEGGALRTDGRTLARVERKSPSEGAAPPVGAVVVFGEGISRNDGQADSRGLLAVGATSLDAFGDASIHIEFRTPFMPSARGQARGNSGVYVQNRYEIQILDSFGLSGEWNEAGGVYKVAKPRVNMAFPPLSWQTYDIDFTAARFEGGVRTEPARMTVRHNGVLIHDDLELPGPTGAGNDETPDPGPLYLQNHGDPIFFKNVWVHPKAS